MTAESIARPRTARELATYHANRCLVAVDAHAVSYLMHVGPEAYAAATIEQVQGILIAAAPIVGTPRTPAAAARSPRCWGSPPCARARARSREGRRAVAAARARLMPGGQGQRRDRRPRGSPVLALPLKPTPRWPGSPPPPPSRGQPGGRRGIGRSDQARERPVWVVFPHGGYGLLSLPQQGGFREIALRSPQWRNSSRTGGVLWTTKDASQAGGSLRGSCS